MNTQLEAFLEFLWEPVGAPLHDITLRELFGRELMAALRAEDVLVRGEEVTWFPCPGGGTTCPRTIHRDFFPGEAKPHFAMCHDQECLHVPVGPEDLRTSAVSLPGLARWLQRLMKLPEEAPLADAVIEQAWALGTQGTGSEERTVIALLTPASPQLRSDLADLRRYGRALALMPLSKWASPELVQAHSGSADVELAFLEHRLRFDNGHFRWVGPVNAAPAPRGGEGAAYAKAFDGGKAKLLTLDEYQRELKRKVGKVDMLIDVAVAQGRNCRMGLKDADGRYEEIWMPVAQAKMLARLVLGQRPMRPSQLRSGPGDHDKLFDRARRRFERPARKSAWRYFLNVPGETPAEMEYVFQPPDGAKYLVLYPPDFVK